MHSQSESSRGSSGMVKRVVYPIAPPIFGSCKCRLCGGRVLSRSSANKNNQASHREFELKEGVVQALGRCDRLYAQPISTKGNLSLQTGTCIHGAFAAESVTQHKQIRDAKTIHMFFNHGNHLQVCGWCGPTTTQYSSSGDLQ